MTCCCVNVLDLCEVNICSVFTIKQEATAPESSIRNIYSLVLDYLDAKIVLQNEQVEGQNIQFDVSSLNENFQYEGKILDASGNTVIILIDGVDYNCIKFQTVVSTGGPVSEISTTPEEVQVNTVVIEDVIGEVPIVTGTTDVVEGLDEDSNTIICDAFIGVRVFVIRGNVPIPSIDPTDGSEFFTKVLGNNFITLSSPLVWGEFIRIQTIPS